MYTGAVHMFPQEEPDRQAYSYTHTLVAPQQRTYTGDATSSAFSAEALKDEDWTQIADLAERRRIQNRIAQRNYRKKLKRRLEELERRVDPNELEGSKASHKKPSPPPTKVKRTPSKAATKPTTETKQQVWRPATQMHLTLPLKNGDDYLFAPYARHNSHTPPMYLPSNAAYPLPEETLPSTYRPTSPYQTEMAIVDNYAYSSMALLSSTVPSVSHFNSTCKPKGFSSDVDFNQVAQHNDMWLYWNTMDPNTNASGPYDRSNTATPPLSHPINQSANCSETGLEFLGLPTTPVSVSKSASTMPHEGFDAARIVLVTANIHDGGMTTEINTRDHEQLDGCDHGWKVE